MNAVLAGWGNIATGLGSELRWLYALLPFCSWYQAAHPILGFGEPLDDPRPVYQQALNWDAKTVDADVAVAVEKFCPNLLAKRLHRQKTKLVVMANPEQASSIATWSSYADVVVSRTDQCRRHLRSMGIKSVRHEVPINLAEFPFRLRDQVSSVVFTNGFGGTHDRKGFPEVRQMLDMQPDCVKVYSQKPLSGICYEGPVPAPADLYAGADLVLMPSRFEGVGLTILEAMASGCLVAATDAEPMSEFMHAAYGPYAKELLLPVASVETVEIGRQKWPASMVDPKAAVQVIERIRALPAAQVRELSLMGRQYVERAHGASAAEALRHLIWERA